MNPDYPHDYIVNSANGLTRNRAQVIADIKSGAQTFESMGHKDVLVRAYGDTAVVTGHTTIKGQYKGQPSLSPTSFTRVYVRLGGQWRLVSNSSSVYAETE
jgi:ketosteroid isomerase-like protein